MDDMTLTQFYDDLKNKVSRSPINSDPSFVSKIGISKPDDDCCGHELCDKMRWRNKAVCKRDELMDKCKKRIIIDIYSKILPLNDDYKDRNMGIICKDVDNMLKSKDMSPTQYLTSCYESTKAPLLKFILNSIDCIGKSYMEDAESDMVDMQKTADNLNDTEPKSSSPEDKEVESQIVDVTSDTEYNTFVDTLKKKTIDKIVNDVSNIITNKKEEEEMTFNVNNNPIDSTQDVSTESSVGVCLDYLQRELQKRNINIYNEVGDEILGLAIREATLNQLDLVFNQKGKEFKEFSSKIRYGRGSVINESTLIKLVEKYQ